MGSKSSLQAPLPGLALARWPLVQTYGGLAASFKVVCGGLFGGGAHDVGEWLGSDHQSNVAGDIVRHRQCLREQVRFGITTWSPAAC